MVAEQPVASASKREADGGMDSELKEAAIFGNVDLLRKALDSKPTEYFLSWAPPDLCYQGGNIFHLVLNRFGSCCNPLPFIREAILRLPKQDVQLLLSQQETRESSNPLHLAACWGCLEIIQLMLNVYKSDSNDPITEDPPGGKPWLACQSHGATPLHMALVYNKEGCALEILSMDMELLCTMLDKNGWDPLYIAVHNGLNVFVAKILESDCSYNVIGEMFEGVVKNCSKEVWGIMYKKHSELLLKTDQHDFSFLHYWVYIGKSSWLLQLLEEVDINALENLSRSVDQEGNTPLHAAVNHGYQEFASYLVEKCTPLDPPLWRCENKDGITPLDMALRNRDEDLAFLFISKDSWTYIEHDSHWQSRLFLAIEAGMDRVVQQICSCVAEGSLKFRIAEYSAFSRIGTTNTDREQPTLLHLVLKCQDTTAKLLLKTFPYLVFNERYPNKKTTIEMTSEVGPEWLTKLLITEHPSSIKSSPNVWITLCSRGHVEALEAFIKYHPDFKKLCIAEQDSPLHHIKLASYQDYEKFLKVPFIWEMRNSPDNEGKTPLHWALERKDILLAEVLLKNGVDRNIRDKKNQSAAKLLAKLCKRDYEWDKMSRRLGINPRLQNLGSSATEMRTTLSVVAALLATLTFAAAFTIPGGFNQDTGEAILATKAYFIVFILADTYAMCCAMLALFCLVWSIVSDQHESQVLIDRSVLVLVHSFYGTLMAFVTGIYAVIHQKSLWAAILVLFMCSLVAIISSRKSFLYKLLDKLVPTIDRKKEKECVV